MEIQTRWRGESGETYTFVNLPCNSLFPKSVGPPEVPAAVGVYIFSHVVGGRHRPIYIGVSGDLNNRLNRRWADHHKRECIESYVPRDVHFLAFPGEMDPEEAGFRAGFIEQDLIVALAPPCNEGP